MIFLALSDNSRNTQNSDEFKKMSWFDTFSFSKYAKTALKQAQKNIDKVLDIKDSEEQINANHSKETQSKGKDVTMLFMFSVQFSISMFS